jgi:hypothetical protein
MVHPPNIKKITRYSGKEIPMFGKQGFGLTKISTFPDLIL